MQVVERKEDFVLVFRSMDRAFAQNLQDPRTRFPVTA
jgi:hypothetical protein